MENLKLYEIRNEFIELFEKTDMEDLTEADINTKVEALVQQLTNKSANIIAYDRTLDTFITQGKAELERISAIVKTAQAKQEKYREYIKNTMESIDIQKVETPIGTLSITKCPMSSVIEDESKVPAEFKKEKITVSVDKTALNKHFKETGELIEGVKFITDKTSLKIK